MSLRSRLSALAVVFGTLGANFGYAPAVVSFAPGTRVVALRLSNFSERPLRLEIVPQRWDQSLTGEVELVPSDDLIATPSVLTMAPRHVNYVRITLGIEPGLREKSYRVLVSELPPFFGQSPSPGDALETRMAINVPVFVAPARAAAISGTIDDAAVRGGVLAFSIANSGNVNFKNKNVRVTALGADAQPILTRLLDAWYVLPGERRRYRLELSAEICRRTRAVAIAVDGGVRLDSTIAVDPRDACRV